MTLTKSNAPLGLALFTLLLIPNHLPAADSVAVVPLFSSQKKVTTGTAISGNSSNGTGVYGYTRNGIAVSGRDDGTTVGKGYGGFFSSNTGIGAAGYSTATSSAGNQYAPGVYGYSKYGTGVYGLSDKSNGYGGIFEGSRGIYARSLATATGYAGYFNGQTYFTGNAFFGGGKFGYVVDFAINASQESLETGDVIIVTGYGVPVIGEIPLLHVRKSEDAETSAIVGVVDQLYIIPDSQQSSAFRGAGNDGIEKDLPTPAASWASREDATAIAPGEYLSFVTLGSYKAIKADAGYGPIVPGSLLVASPNPGHAMAVESPVCGTVIGKALGDLDSGTGLIPVMVTLQ